MSNSAFQFTVRVYYEDTDAGGVVYHSNYLNYLERARTEWLRNLGYEQDVLIEQEQLIFAVRNIAIDYILPAKFNDLLTVSTMIENISGVSLEFKQQVFKQESLLAEATVQIVALDSQSLKPKRLNTKIKEDLTRVSIG